jgi:hypothetical protein
MNTTLLRIMCLMLLSGLAAVEASHPSRPSILSSDKAPGLAAAGFLNKEAEPQFLKQRREKKERLEGQSSAAPTLPSLSYEGRRVERDDKGKQYVLHKKPRFSREDRAFQDEEDQGDDEQEDDTDHEVLLPPTNRGTERKILVMVLTKQGTETLEEWPDGRAMELIQQRAQEYLPFL